MLISNLGCSYHWYLYAFNPRDINLDKYELSFFVRRAAFSESLQKYVPTQEVESDTFFILTVQYKFSDVNDVAKYNLMFRNVRVQIDSNPNYIELTVEKEYKARKPEFYNSVLYKPFRYSGPVPRKMNVNVDVIVEVIKTGQLIDSSSIQATAYRVKRSKSILRDFLDGD